MSFVRTTLICFLMLFSLSCLAAPAARAENAVLAAGAGYKKMVNALNEAYAKASGHKLDLLFGNMARVTTLANQSGKVDIVLGDGKFLKKAGLPFASSQVLGHGKLVLAFAKDSRYSKITDLDNPEAGRIALPDGKKAIYGKAARQYLKSSGRLPNIQPRLVEVSTVPQVFSYLATNEVDMGFMNLTHALNVAGKLGGYKVIDGGYEDISIISGMLTGCPHQSEAKAFLNFLKTADAVWIIRENGL